MKTTKKLWMFAAILIICGSSVFTGCSNDDDPVDSSSNQATTSQVLLKTTTSWDGVTLPSYFTDRPVMTLVRYTIPPHTMLKPHFHKLINGGMVVSGELTIVRQDGTLEKTLHAGEAVVEMVNTWHHGENRGDEPIDLVMGYFGNEDTPLSSNEGILPYTVPDGMTTEGVKSEVLLRTSTSWDGVTLPFYPTEQPTISIVRYAFPAHASLAPHYHTIINGGVLLSGQLTIFAEDGSKQKTLQAGDAVVEMVNTWHHGENRGDTPGDLIMFYAGTSTSNLSDK